MPTLDWIGEKAVLNHRRQVPYRLVRCHEKLSVGDPGTGNLLVQGDNLLALKAVLPYYAGQAKSFSGCIHSAAGAFHQPPFRLHHRKTLRTPLCCHYPWSCKVGRCYARCRPGGPPTGSP